jgi:hypothetical protein
MIKEVLIKNRLQECAFVDDNLEEIETWLLKHGVESSICNTEKNIYVDSYYGEMKAVKGDVIAFVDDHKTGEPIKKPIVFSKRGFELLLEQTR